MIDIASGVGWPGMAHGNKATVVHKTGLTGSTGLIYRKGREERKAQLHESLYLEEIIRQGRRQKGSGVLT